MRAIVKLSRRDLLGRAAALSGLVLGLPVGFRTFPADAAPEGADFAPDVYVAIDAAGDVSIVAHRSEMGTGIRTGLPQVLADELEADWRRVRVVQAQGDAKYGDQNTDGSRSVRQFYEPMRLAGATARQMLEAAAAQIWRVAPEQCRAINHEIVDHASGRRLGFGELVALARTLPVPARDALRFKPASARRYVGHPVPIVDLKAILRGSATYGIDVRLPGMRYACVERCPVYGGRVKSFDAQPALAVRGVERVVEIAASPLPSGFKPLGGVAVVACDTWTAQQGRERLRVEWDLGPNAGHDSAAYRAELEATARRPGRIVRQHGDVDAALAGAAQRIAADYFVPYYAHAPMEVPACAARVTGKLCEVWAPTQNPQGARTILAQVLGVPETNVTVNVTLLGGGFGRKSKPDFIAEAALLSRSIGAPVLLTWTREDEIRHDYYHAISAQHLEGGLDAEGRAVAWLHRTVFPSIQSTFKPEVSYGAPGELGQGVTDLPYAIPNLRAENGPARNHVRIGWLRSVYNIPHAFAVCSFADELAAAARQDPLDYLRRLIGPARRIDLAAEGVDYPNYGASLDAYPIDTGRLGAVLDRAARNSGWGEALPPRQGRGIAVHRSFLTYVAAVAQVAVAADGEVAVKRIDMAVDAGLVVNPDRVRAQMEGAAIFGMALALYSTITVKNGRVEQSNLTDYLLPRIDAAPEVHVDIVASEAPPAGIGEPGVPPIAPAICNAIFAATGKRIRALPVDSGQLRSS